MGAIAIVTALGKPVIELCTECMGTMEAHHRGCPLAPATRAYTDNAVYERWLEEPKQEEEMF